MVSTVDLLGSISTELAILEYSLEDFEISGASTLEKIKPNTFVFVKKLSDRFSKFPHNVVALLEDSSIASNFKNYILTDNCRLAFALSLSLFNHKLSTGKVCSSSIISNGCEIHPGSSIGSFVRIDEGASVADDVVIESHCFIGEGVIIGRGSYIKSGARIGVQGFGFERSSENVPIRMWHSGGVRIGENCEVGSNTIICSGTIDPTVLSDFVKIDDNCHIAHNCRIGARTMIAGCASVGGSVFIGEDAWIGPNSSIINKAQIGNRAKIILGSVVMRSVKDDVTYMSKRSNGSAIE